LGQVMEVGDFIKFNAAKVSRVPPPGGDAGEGVREIQYITTAMVVAKTAQLIKKRDFPTAAAKVTDISQVTQGKIANFRTVTEFLRKKKLNSKEMQVLESIEKGELAANVLDSLSQTTIEETDSEEEESGTDESDADEDDNGNDADDADDDDDDDIMVVAEFGDTAESKPVSKKPIVKPMPDKTVVEVKKPVETSNKTENEVTKLANEMKQKELRKFIMSYIVMLAKVKCGSKTKLKVSHLKKVSGATQSNAFLAKLLVALGKECLKSEKGGVKVAHVFLTQPQVLVITEKGVTADKHLDMSEDISELNGSSKQSPPKKAIVSDVVDVASKYNSNVIKQILQGFIKLIDGEMTVMELAKSLLMDKKNLEKVLGAIVKRCEANMASEGGFKINNIFVSTLWKKKIANSGAEAIY